ncbi:MAG: sodium-translocating pyrophosphatase [Syntrophobacterales bacterium CG_4_8_14_3_um_filter_58_8]|nr:MAG: sodium-translocating pyrophosphatase [Syntrophaceae bacterium CG2_30_58_14]PIV02267.1 MAG: sodium-translocating pyrophosphatase [Syntrophobacterales bacterium CG03_land_8_20_14_0_80_58_14]PJC72314.1 MAG: sodium-translocating pyrophosphatase [Syntrophobacterales bacterium CG_4_8_14_3_um_filter_58_8]
MCSGKRSFWPLLCSLAIILFWMTPMAFAGEADIKIPDLTQVAFMGGSLGGLTILNIGLLICAIGMIFGWFQFTQTKNLPSHQAMLDVSNTIWETCKTYLFQQGKFLAGLWVLIAICIVYYFVGLQGNTIGAVVIILFCSVMGILGSYGVAWFGIRINTVANSRAAFASLSGNPLSMVNICLRSGMSVGLLLVSIELFFMILILAYIPKELAGPCFIGFAVGESLGASALRICGGIFTKIADIGSDLMKIIFHLPEDDPKNPGVIADCTGDNAGDSVGPTADGFETYGVTGVALIAFLALAFAGNPAMGGKLIVWIFAMRILMIITSLASYFINDAASKSLYTGKKEFDFEQPLTNLVWITSCVSIIITFIASYLLLGDLPAVGGSIATWLALSIIISCGTVAGALIPEFTKIFTSTKSRHCEEVVNASRQGGASLNILSGLVAGNFSAFWEGLIIMILMLIAYLVSQSGSVTGLMPKEFLFAAPVFAFGLVAFGFLGMGPVTIAVDSFGPVSDNAQSIYELSMIESRKDAREVVRKHFGVETDFEKAKHYLESADGAGNTFKATAKPVLIGTAVVGATTMVFGIIILLERLFGNVIANLSLVQPNIILGLLMGGCVIYWFTGASIQAVVTGSYQAVVYIKDHIKLDKKEASIEDSKEVVKICTIYAQKGMINIFVVIFFMALALAFFNAYFFIGYLVGIAFFGLFQAIFMANAGGCWDNAKKIVEVDLKQKNTPLHEASVVGDTVGDPFKDTSSVSLNPVIKFTTLFGLLAVEIAVTMQSAGLKIGLACLFFLVALIFVYRSFYGMRITGEKIE